jgi:hypothetical protein
MLVVDVLRLFWRRRGALSLGKKSLKYDISDLLLDLEERSLDEDLWYFNSLTLSASSCRELLSHPSFLWESKFENDSSSRLDNLLL